MSLNRLSALIAFCLIFGCSNDTDNAQPSSSSSDIQSSSSSDTQPSSSSDTQSSSSSDTQPSSSSNIQSSSSSDIQSSSSSDAQSSSSIVVRQIDCTRQGLANAVDFYLEALAASDYTLMPLASSAKYYESNNDFYLIENYKTWNHLSEFGKGLWQEPIIPNHHMNLIDVEACATFTEIIVANTEPQYVIGTKLIVEGNKISEVRALVTVAGDWLFNAKNYLKYSEAEDWSVLPEDQHLAREKLLSGAKAFFAYFSNKTVEVPWGVQCARLEGGTYTGDGSDRCAAGIPNLDRDLENIWWLVDVDHGMVVINTCLGGPDTHLFRILPTGIRYIHTLTAMRQSDFSGTSQFCAP